MSLIIKGVDMPRDCWDCPCHGDDYGETVCAPLGRKLKCYPDSPRFDDCPLIPIPPHGRLIDADALAKLEVIPSDNWVFRAIEKAPTIIPAEKDGAK